MTEYLTIADVCALLKCERKYAARLIEKVGRANLAGLVRVEASKLREYLARPECDSTSEGTTGGRGGQKAGLPLGARPGARPKTRRGSSSRGGSESVRIPYTPPARAPRSE